MDGSAFGYRKQALSKLFRVKICGVTSAADAQMSINAGADAIGLNFFSGSPRSVDVEKGKEICGVIGSTKNSPRRVGVFVNHSINDICEIVDCCSLDLVQLHGDETPQFALELGRIELLPVLRVSMTSTVVEVVARIDAWLETELKIAGILLDAQVGKAFGGTGHRVDWELARNVVEQTPVPVVLAGGTKC